MATQWTEALSLGVAEIDEQHKELFRRVDQVLAGLAAGDRSEISRLLDFLGQYVVVHFGAEEGLMRSRAYPDFPMHKAEHDRFLEDLAALHEEHRAQGPTEVLVSRVNRQVADWLRVHILGTDAVLARWLRSHPAS